MEEAEKQFLERNLQLLAEHCNIDAAKAQIIQARLFDNPSIEIEQNIYNPINGKYFDFGPQGQTAVNIQQLITLAGKRGKRVNIEKANTDLALYQFEELLRNLKNELHTSFIQSYFIDKSLSVYDKETEYLAHLISVYEVQQGKGNISLMEKSRLKALLFTLQNEKTELRKELTDAQKDLNLLLCNNPETLVIPVIPTSNIEDLTLSAQTFSDLMDSIRDRSDLKYARSNVQLGEGNLKLQKAMRVPDVTMKGIWDKDGNFVHNYFALTLAVDLPIFNRNQGNIRSAQAQLEQSKILQQQKEREIQSELFASYKKAEEDLKFYKAFDQSLTRDFEQLIAGVNRNFEQRNISMLEFIDYYNTYKETSLQRFEVEKKILLSLEDLNFVAGRDVVKLFKQK